MREDRNLESRVKDALRALGPVSMTDTERSDLRRAVWSELTSGAPAPGRSPWGWRLAGATAALAVVVGAAAIFGNLGADDTADLLEASDETTVTFAAADSKGSQGAEAPPGRDDGDGAGGEGHVTASPETEGALSRYAEMVRTGTPAEFRMTETESACAGAGAVEGLRVVAMFEVEGTEFEAWVPEGEPIDADTQVTFVDARTCSVAANE